MSECLFCKMLKKEIPADVVYQDDDVMAFNDINPQAPIHVLIIPCIHLETINDLQAEHTEIVGKLFLAAKEIAKQKGIAEGGYRTVINCNADAGQTVFHLHLHLLGGRQMDWPPG